MRWGVPGMGSRFEMYEMYQPVSHQAHKGPSSPIFEDQITPRYRNPSQGLAKALVEIAFIENTPVFR